MNTHTEEHILGCSVELGPMAKPCHEKMDRTFLFVGVGRGKTLSFETRRPHEVYDPWSSTVIEGREASWIEFFPRCFEFDPFFPIARSVLRVSRALPALCCAGYSLSLANSGDLILPLTQTVPMAEPPVVNIHTPTASFSLVHSSNDHPNSAECSQSDLLYLPGPQSLRSLSRHCMTNSAVRPTPTTTASE